MFRTLRWAVIPCAVTALIAADGAKPWIEKPSAEWTEEEAKEILSDSPWAQQAPVEPTPPKRSKMPQITLGGGRSNGPFGMPGSGGSRPGGGGVGNGGPFPGGQYPSGGGQRGGQQGGGNRDPRITDDYVKAAPVTIRWESALPIQEAEQKAGDAGAETAGKAESGVYRIAIYGFDWVPEDAAKELKKHAILEVDGMKDIKASKVQVLRRESGPVIVYTFPRSTKISVDDYAITFNAELGRMTVAGTFLLEKMVYNDKLEM